MQPERRFCEAEAEASCHLFLNWSRKIPSNSHTAQRIKMDPLSITASVIAVCSALKVTVDLVKSIPNLRKAPAEFLDLQNEVLSTTYHHIEVELNIQVEVADIPQDIHNTRAPGMCEAESRGPRKPNTISYPTGPRPTQQRSPAVGKQHQHIE